ncbi:hypothetical protein PENTCL1PPCAC_12852, partial [Pristionchus entomophagus]
DSSKPPNIADYSFPLLIKDLDDLIHGLGYDTATVLGHDWGGGVAWTHALNYPQSVHRLIVCNIPHPAVSLRLLSTNKEQQSRSWYTLFFKTPRLPEAYTVADDFKLFDDYFRGHYGFKKQENFTVEDMEAWKCTFSKPGCLRSALNYYRALFQNPGKGFTMETCTVKTLILWG